MTELKPLDLASEEKMPHSAAKTKLIGWFFLLVLLGTASGYGLTKLKGGAAVKSFNRTATDSNLTKGNTFGIQDEKTFPDQTEGALEQGGIDGEGSHHLNREGGESQTVYLTSSIIDLDQFIGKKVKVWGQTFEAQKAGWLMDVGRLEVLE